MNQWNRGSPSGFDMETSGPAAVESPLPVQNFNIEFDLKATLKFRFPPPPPGPLTILFALKGKIMTGTVSFVSPSTDTTVTSRPVSLTINGSAQPTLDCFTTQTFACNDGDAIVLTPLGDINPVGPGPAGTPFSVTATVGGGLPPIPGPLTVTFA